MIPIVVLVIVIGIMAPKPAGYMPHKPGVVWYLLLALWFYYLTFHGPAP